MRSQLIEPQSKATHLEGIDHIRAILAILIVFYHCLNLLSYEAQAINSNKSPFDFWQITTNPFWAFIIEGHTAVAGFMVLSGFIFSYTAGLHNINALKFYKNRFLRIYPLFITLFAVSLISEPQSFQLIGFLQTLIMFSDLQGALIIGPFAAMFWALAVEFKFYFLFTFLQKFLNRYGILWIILLILEFSILLSLTFLSGKTNPRDLYYWTFVGRLPQFLFGMLAGNLRFKHQTQIESSPNYQKILLFFSASATLLLTISLFNQSGGWPALSLFKIFYGVIEGFTWAFFIYTYLSVSQYLPRFLNLALSKVALLSYSIYLLHIPLIRILPQYFNITFSDLPNLNSQIYALLIVLPCLIVISTLTYYTIEKPFLSLKTKYLE